jgi:hypothetical protein
VTPGVRYTFNPDINFSAGYDYRWRKDLNDNTTANQNRVFAQVYFQYPLLEN